MIHTLSRAIILDKDQILLVYDPSQEDPSFYLPGGHIEENETALQALKRELKEEIGLDTFTEFVYLGCLEHIFTESSCMSCHSHEYSFCFLTASPDLSKDFLPRQMEPHVQFRWVPLSLLPEIKLYTPTLPEALKRWIGQKFQDAFFSFDDSLLNVRQLQN